MIFCPGHVHILECTIHSVKSDVHLLGFFTLSYCCSGMLSYMQYTHTQRELVVHFGPCWHSVLISLLPPGRFVN
uniref:Uncharacterized protein n=1 Tax=Anguilla anguilla TaxID=7936 RepID=A0A0E9WR01_ANGAN